MPFSLLTKYGVDLSLYRTSSYPKMEAVLALCEQKSLKIFTPAFKKKGMSGNSFVCYHCSCGGSAESMVSGFLDKTVFACKKCNAGLINKMFKPRVTNDLIALVESKSFKVVAHNHTTSMQSSTWTLQCSQGHEFSRFGGTIGTIKEHSCPKCWNPSVEESWTRLLVETHFGTSFPNMRPDWLVSAKTGRGLELDMYNASMKLAFEYHGVQHFKPIFGEHRLVKSQCNDAARRECCIKHGVRLIELMHPPKTYGASAFLHLIADQLKAHGVHVHEQVIDKVSTMGVSVNGAKAMSEKLTIILKNNNMTWLSGAYVNSASVLNVRNNCCGKELSKPVGSIRNLANFSRTRCIACIGRNTTKSANAIARHTHIAEAMCKSEGYTLKSLRFNPAGHCSGFVYVDCLGNEKIIGNKRYKRFTIENNFSVINVQKNGNSGHNAYHTV